MCGLTGGECNGGPDVGTGLGWQASIGRLSFYELPIMLVSKHVQRTSIAVALVFALAASVVAEDGAPLNWVPPSCNAVAVIHMRKLVNSPMGRKQKWSDKVRGAYAEGLLSAPPWVKEAVRATTFGSMAAGRSVSYSMYAMDQQSIMGDIVRHEKASSEKIAGAFACLSPRGIYFVQLAPGILGAVQPPDRQAVSAWVRSGAASNESNLSPYLKTALDTPDNALIVIAVDLTDMLNPPQVRAWLAASPHLKVRKNLDEVAALVASIRGARLSVNVTDTANAQLVLDFENPISNQSLLREVVLQWLDDAGAQTEIIGQARTSVVKKSFAFEAPLNEPALRRLLSLIQSPHLPGKDETANLEHAAPNVVATAAYYDSVCDLLNSLIRKNENAVNYEKTALWHETFAKKIANLSTTGVDPELAAWGRDVSGKLMALASSLRGVRVEVNKLENSIRVNTSTDYSWYANSAESGPMYFPSWVHTQSNEGDVRAQQQDVIAKNADQREMIWSMLRNATAQVAHDMEYKYNIKLKLPN
jgi:hypothetical protein